LLTRLNRDIALHFAHDIFIEPDYQPAPFRFFASACAKIIDIVPAIFMKNIGNYRRAEQKTNLVTGHADLDTFHILWFQLIALLDIKFINTASCEAY